MDRTARPIPNRVQTRTGENGRSQEGWRTAPPRGCTPPGRELGRTGWVRGVLQSQKEMARRMLLGHERNRSVQRPHQGRGSGRVTGYHHPTYEQDRPTSSRLQADHALVLEDSADGDVEGSSVHHAQSRSSSRSDTQKAQGLKTTSSPHQRERP